MLRRRQRIILNRLNSLTHTYIKKHTRHDDSPTQNHNVESSRKTHQHTCARILNQKLEKKSKVSIQKHEAHREQQFKQTKTKTEKTSRNVLIWNLLLLLSMKITPPSKEKQTNKSENKRTQDYWTKSEIMKRTMLSTNSEHVIGHTRLPSVTSLSVERHTNTDTQHT